MSSPTSEEDEALSAALGWPGGISEPLLDRAALLRLVASAGVELASMRRCFDAAERERGELRDRAERAEAERDALRVVQPSAFDPAEALRLADECESLSQIADAYSAEAYEQAAAELRRQHAEIEQLKAERDALRADAGRWAPLLHAAGRVLQAVDDGYLQPDPETLQGSIAIDALREAWGTFAPARIKRGSND